MREGKRGGEGEFDGGRGKEERHGGDILRKRQRIRKAERKRKERRANKKE